MGKENKENEVTLIELFEALFSNNPNTGATGAAAPDMDRLLKSFNETAAQVELSTAKLSKALSELQALVDGQSDDTAKLG